MSGTVRPPSITSEADPRPPSVTGGGVGPSSAAGSGPRPQASRLNSVDGSGGRALSGADLPLVCPTCGVRYPPEFRVCPRDATTLDDAANDEEPDEMVGQSIANTYSIVRVIGEGGMGRVYEARHKRINSKRFAIKMLHPEFSRRTEVLSRFQREAEAAASISNHHVVEVYDVHRTEDGRPYMVGEFLEGVELADHLNAVGRLPLALAVRITRQLCDGMSAAHALGIVHRDMKPENVFLAGDLENPTTKVIDFGISKTGDSPGTQLTKTGMIMGTPSFMAPEQARGEKVTHLVDVYAVGAILYTMLTGQRPFDRSDPTATLTAVLIEDPPRPRSIEPSIPESVEAIVQRAMAKTPADRYATLAELDRALAPYDSLGEIAPAPGSRNAATNARATLDSAHVGDLEAASARPLLVILGSVGGVVALGAVLTLITAIVRMARGADANANLSGFEALVLILILVAGLAAPIALGIKHFRRTIWDNTARAVDLARQVKWPVLVGLAAYGFGSMVVRTIEAVFLRRAVGVAWPVWDIVMIGIAGAAIAGLYLAPRLDRRDG